MAVFQYQRHSENRFFSVGSLSLNWSYASVRTTFLCWCLPSGHVWKFVSLGFLICKMCNPQGWCDRDFKVPVGVLRLVKESVDSKGDFTQPWLESCISPLEYFLPLWHRVTTLTPMRGNQPLRPWGGHCSLTKEAFTSWFLKKWCSHFLRQERLSFNKTQIAIQKHLANSPTLTVRSSALQNTPKRKSKGKSQTRTCTISTQQCESWLIHGRLGNGQWIVLKKTAVSPGFTQERQAFSSLSLSLSLFFFLLLL